jgi:hypothetical protein
MHPLKSKLQHKFLESSKAKEHMRTACSGLSSVLGIAKDAASNSGIPGLATALGGLQYLLDAIQVR